MSYGVVFVVGILCGWRAPAFAAGWKESRRVGPSRTRAFLAGVLSALGVKAGIQ